MFTLSRSPFGKFEKIDLADPATGNGFSLSHAPGATLTSLRFGGLETLDGYQTPDELATYKWSKSAVLMPFPNRLFDGKMPYQGQNFDWPINNADTGNAIHGYLRERDFEVVEIKVGQKEASVRLRFEETGGFAPFPFRFRFDVVFSMKKNGRFTTAFYCKNLGKTLLPVGFGWHPYFRIGDAGADVSSLQMTDCQRVMIDSRMIPTGGKVDFDVFQKEKNLIGESLDTCFFSTKKGTWAVALSTKKGRLTMCANAAVWPFFQVFTPPHRASVAIEPMSCNVNAHQNGEGLVELSAGGAWRGAFHVFFEKK